MAIPEACKAPPSDRVLVLGSLNSLPYKEKGPVGSLFSSRCAADLILCEQMFPLLL